MPLPCCRQMPEGVMIDLHVQPRASRNGIAGLQGAELKVRLTSPPVDGAANQLCCEYFAKLLGVPKSAVVLAAGEKSRHKRLLVRGIGADTAERVLAPLIGT